MLYLLQVTADFRNQRDGYGEVQREYTGDIRDLECISRKDVVGLSLRSFYNISKKSTRHLLRAGHSGLQSV